MTAFILGVWTGLVLFLIFLATATAVVLHKVEKHARARGWRS